MQKQKMRMLIRSFDYRLIDKITNEIALKIGKLVPGKVSGPIPLPSEINKFTVNRSPHIDRKSKETFARITHKRVLEFPIFEAILNELKKTEIPPGLGISIKTIDSSKKTSQKQQRSK